MARLGIDFGTTNTVASIQDRGVFSIVLHTAETGVGSVTQEVFPSSILIDASGQRLFGIEADRRFMQLGAPKGGAFVSSLKRELREYVDGHTISFGDHEVDVAELLTQYLCELASSIRQSQSFDDAEPLEVVITWPANCNGAQRYITRKAFREAGFIVIDSVNEPTASVIELADRIAAGESTKPSAIAVFDLGGGTFDASIVATEEQDFNVRSSAGIEDLGGDDFDRVLLGMLLRKLKVNFESLNPMTRLALLRHARSQKEMISTGAVMSLFMNPQDFGLKGKVVSIQVSSFYRRLRTMLEPTIEMLANVIRDADVDQEKLTVYLVGGSSKLPLVANMVSKAFPDCRVMQTDKPFRSVAMGAAICAADRVTFRDMFARHFGLIRLRDHGRTETFDAIFPAGTPIPRKGEAPLERVVSYHPAHNVGRLRYLECTAIDDDGMPDGSVRAWSDILFPYDPQNELSSRISADDICQTDRFSGEMVNEVYRCDTDGVITVELQRESRCDSRLYEICCD